MSDLEQDSSGSAKPKYEHVVLALQGGGALGAYQAGVYEGLSEAGVQVDWVVGVSIGAINAALIAGNPPERRVERLKEFWDRVSRGFPFGSFGSAQALEIYRPFFNWMGVASVATFGVPGFFSPRGALPFMAPAGSAGALSLYDTEPLNATLAELVDFDLLKTGPVRLALGVVNVRTGESVYFDSKRIELRPDHIRASGALPPSFPPVEIDGELYWDGGITSNSPLWYAFDQLPHKNALIFQVDLFSPQGDVPQDLRQVQERTKDIQYASKQRFSLERIDEREALRASLRRVLEKLPDDLKSDADVQQLAAAGAVPALAWVRFVNQRLPHSTHFKDADFSRATVTELWAAGLDDARRAVRDGSFESAVELGPGIHFFDVAMSPLGAQTV